MQSQATTASDKTPRIEEIAFKIFGIVVSATIAIVAHGWLAL